MKITKEQLRQIIKEEIENALAESGYDRQRDYQLTHGGSRYKQKERYRAIRRQQMRDSAAAEKLGREDALAGKEENPDQLDSYKRLYSKAYDEAMKDVAKSAGMNFFNYDSLGQGEEPEKDYEFWQTNYEGKYLDSFEDGEREAALNHEDALYDLGL